MESLACKNATGSPCLDQAIFWSGHSKSWTHTGIYRVPSYYLEEFGYGTGAEWGQDNVVFGNNIIRDIGFAKQLVALAPSLEFFIGVFGLSDGAISLSGPDQPTLLSAIAGAHATPSSSFGYTAGSAKNKISS